MFDRDALLNCGLEVAAYVQVPAIPLDLGVVHEAVVEHPAAAVLWETVSDASSYVRAEVRDARGEMLAISNPIWIDTAASGADPEH